MKKVATIAILFIALLIPEIGCTIDEKLLEGNTQYFPYVGPITDDVRIV
jgi:hypothetical protein